MGVAALISWLVTASGGLYLLVIWLIENDTGSRYVMASRLPLPVISGHALLAMAGLAVWSVYLLTDRTALAWAAAATLAVVALLGLAMVARWIGVYRAPAGPDRRAAGEDRLTVPAERNFPALVVLGHGVLAASTIALVLLVALGVGD
jgi:hypothetical protein